MKYTTIEHHSSNRSARRGLCGWTTNPKTGLREFKDHVTIQVFRDNNGTVLPHRPLLVRRNKYTPHVGKKQLAKAAIRNHVAA